MKKHTICFCVLFFVTAILSSKSWALATEKEQDKKNIKSDLNTIPLVTEKEVEIITVHGEYIGLESAGVQGSFYLDQEFIDFTPKTTGDINELVALLPGVQVSETAVDISELAEISALPISISGGQPWQTGFFLDGLNTNNVVDPSSNVRTSSNANEVGGGAQTMNVNSQIISSIEVFDNNIPVEYGDFSGGVVQANSKSAFELGETEFQFGYRGNQADWGSYHTILPPEEEGGQARLDFDDSTPTFKKRNFNMLLSKKFNKRHGFLASLSFVDSKFSDISLGELKQESRENINALFQYAYRGHWVDELNVSLVYAPYKSNEYLKDVLNSEFTLDGGSTGILVKATHGFETYKLYSSIDIALSENSRVGPAHYYEWIRAKGKDWSRRIDDDSASDDALFISKEGGFGNLDNTQLTQSWKTKLVLDSIDWANLTHHITAGWQIQNRIVERHRAQDHYGYDQARIYSAVSNAQQLNCSGYQNDCVERELAQSIESLEQQLGGSLDFNNPEHVQAYSDNILVTPQYFVIRQVTPAENVKENLVKLSSFFSDSLETGNFQLNIGLRYDYDDFYQNHNIAPRNQFSYDLFEDGSTRLIAGLNRYYSAGQIGNKIKAQQQLPFNQFRPINNGALQGWLDFSVNGDFKYRFTNLKTPFDDEFVLGWKQTTKDFGQYSVKWVKRWKKDQLARNAESPLEQDGYKYITYNNDGDGSSERISFSWNGYYSGHSLWFNTSYSKNKISTETSNDSLSELPTDEFVFYGDEIVSFDTLSLIRSNFGRPITANLGWNYRWANYLSTGLTVRHLGAYDAAKLLPYKKSTGDIGLICAGCESINLSLPAYQKVRYNARTTFSLNTTWEVKLSEMQHLNVRLDINNLLNSRTNRIVEELGESGIEVGRQIWLGIQYQYD